MIEAVSCFKPNGQQWSLKVDINSTDEFKQKVPAMAIEVNINFVYLKPYNVHFLIGYKCTVSI